MSERIEKIEVTREKVPLRRPYALPFTTLHDFDSMQVRVQNSLGEFRTAEVVPLPGYSNETPDAIFDFLQSAPKRFEGQLFGEVRGALEADLPTRPFAVSPLITALDLFDWKWEHEDFETVPTVVTGSTGDLPHLATLFEGTEAKTVKIKLTGSAETDVAAILELDAVLASAQCPVRLDANQEYSLEEARQVAGALDRSSHWLEFLECLEQPLHGSKWDEMKTLVAEFPKVPFMLDEPIGSEADVRRAISTGASLVKLKLFKQGGIREVLSLAKLCHQNGLRVILGNGVATGISNEVELRLQRDYPELFWGASEANGFKKVANGGDGENRCGF